MKASDWNSYQKNILIPFYRDKLHIEYCENCGGTFALSFHHLLRRSRGGQNTLENIMLLCAYCHFKADNSHGHVEFNARLIEKANKRYWIVENVAMKGNKQPV